MYGGGRLARLRLQAPLPTMHLQLVCRDYLMSSTAKSRMTRHLTEIVTRLLIGRFCLDHLVVPKRAGPLNTLLRPFDDAFNATWFLIGKVFCATRTLPRPVTYVWISRKPIPHHTNRIQCREAAT